MKTFLLLILLLQVTLARADMPYMPLKFILSTGKPVYMEGERIDFILTIKNTDPARSYPVLTPGGANAGKKLIYLRVFDPAKNLYVERGMEQRDMRMNIKSLGKLGLLQLAPGREISIPFYWNDAEHYLDKPESHHSFGKPIFAGRHNFQAFYDPSGTGIGDSLYHFMSSTDDEQSTDKLNFLGPAMSQPCLVVIEHGPSGDINIEGITYTVSADTPRPEYYKYYQGPVHDSNLVYISISQGAGKSPHLEVPMRRYKNLEWIEHYENGNIRKHNKSREQGCPEVYYSRQFQYNNENIPAEVTNMDASGTVRTTRYYEDGRPFADDIYLMPAQVYMSVRYLYNKNNKLIRKKKQSSKFKIPCEIVILEREET